MLRALHILKTETLDGNRQERAEMGNRCIGIMLELMWPYRRHVDVFAGTQRFARDAGDWECEIDEFYRDGAGSQKSQLAGFDGLIARATGELASRAKLARVPLVNVWYNSPAMNQLPGVFPDFSKIGVAAAEHVVERGFRQFGCLSSPRERAHQTAVDAFHQVIQARGHQCHCCQVSRSYYRTQKSWSQFRSELETWIATWKPPIALFIAFNDVTLRYVVHACRRHGLRVPEDVALIGATNEPMIDTMPPPSLTSVDVNYEQIGFQASQMLQQLMQGIPLPQQHVLVPPSGVIARDSTDFFAVDDETVALAMRYIEQHTGNNIDVDRVAEAAGVSRRTLERRFRISSGRSIAKEIRRLRILKAKRLLAETDLLIKQIARETGFRSAIRLHEVFVREEQMTPTAYRQRIRGEK